MMQDCTHAHASTSTCEHVTYCKQFYSTFITTSIHATSINSRKENEEMKSKLQNDKIIVNNTNFTLKLQKDQKERDRRLKMIEERLKEKEEIKKKEEEEQQ